MDFLTTVKGSLLDGFHPKGWDMKKIDECCEKGVAREDFWHKDFTPVECENIYEFDTLMGHEIALKIKEARDCGEKLVLIFGIGRMCHIAFWEPQFADEFSSVDEWKKQDTLLFPATLPTAIWDTCLSSPTSFATSAEKKL